MGARLNVVFHEGDVTQPTAVIYGHWAGDDPMEASETLANFFAAVEAQTGDHRYNDPSYLAAKYVVFLATGGGKATLKPMHFLSVGVVESADAAGPSCIAYVNCGSVGKVKGSEHPRPLVTFGDDTRRINEAMQILGQQSVPVAS